MSTGRRAWRPRAQSPPRAGSPPSGPGRFTPSGRGPRPCLEAGCAVVPAGYCALRCRGRRVLTATPGAGCRGSAVPVGQRAGFSPPLVPHWTRDPAGDSPTSRGSLWNLPNNSGSQPRLFRPHGTRRAWAVAGTSSWNPGPLSIFRPPLAICHPFWYRESLVCSNCAPRACVGLGGGAA